MSEPVEHDDLEAAEAIFREYLRDRGLKYTRERRAVLRGVMRNERHFEADELLAELRTGGQRVAKATIYRTLPLLVECRIIRPVHLDEKQTYYEHTCGHSPHDHMQCKRCGRLVEFDSSEVSRLAAALARGQGFHVVSHRFQIVGFCPDCARAVPVPKVGGRAKSSRRTHAQNAGGKRGGEAHDWVSLL
jgi:Fur family transcriptional regulator, ferric uptake regulator